MTTLSAYGTHVGLVRDHNEDSYLARPDIGLWAVTDGMGGHLGGEIASGIVVTELARHVESGESLARAVAATHHAVLDAVANGEGQRGMGATVVALKVTGVRYQVAWVGDSRAYLIGNHGLRQITRDHSFVQKLLDAGAITEADAATHPDRSVVMQAIGTDGVAEVKADVVEGKFHKGDQILLCSDGLSSEVSDQAISDLMSAPGNLASKIEALILAALSNGGSDNVTVVLVAAPEDALENPSRGSTIPIDANRLNQAIAGKTRLHNSPVAWFALGGVLLAILFVVIWLSQGSTANLTISTDINVKSPIQ
jgi:serine/threonine protein phosphatase PrpC